MTPDRWIVTTTGLALIALIVWFFSLKRSTGFRATETSGVALIGGDTYCPTAPIIQRRLIEQVCEYAFDRKHATLGILEQARDLPGATVAGHQPPSPSRQ